LAVAHHTLQQADLRLKTSMRIEKRPATTKTRAEKILIVEDDSHIAMALALRLKAAGYQTMLAFDALLGLSTALKTPPALVLLDVSMPAGNGLDLAEKLQKLLPEPPPIIFLTASKQSHFRQKAQELGAAGFFEKPYEAEGLMAVINKTMERSLDPEKILT
jgi:DNA-binding response OmpR family regulator